ncbi:hypothetical protein CBB2_2580 [Clostridium botulinum]|uniref:toll/interleukin-1 receptor domain-containing protein n=2 Tax=Clostridium botulinum TaxID=1491 RepID=UPI0005822A40|nr:toll/interleukin-1 receptor domain-containing protein [Clostridium botulinum]BAQ14690.1 hypothetical protein CBB2_2580 [Clostridium botulinum]
MSQGINRALNNEYKSFNERYGFSSAKPCIFLSHRSLDKDAVEDIGKYIKSKGIDIYLDKYDQNLQRADKEGNDKDTTECIQKGLKSSTHIMCILSEDTVNSWWVPYEIGYGEKIPIEISSLKLAELEEKEIPAFLRIRNCMMGRSELDNYLEKIIRIYNTLTESEYKTYKNQKIMFEYASVHPLAKYLDK